MRRRRSGEKYRSPGEDDFSSEDGGPPAAFRMTIFPDGNREKTSSLKRLEIRLCTKNDSLSLLKGRKRLWITPTIVPTQSLTPFSPIVGRIEQRFYIPIWSEDLTVSTKSSATGRLPSAANWPTWTWHSFSGCLIHPPYLPETAEEARKAASREATRTKTSCNGPPLRPHRLGKKTQIGLKW